MSEKLEATKEMCFYCFDVLVSSLKKPKGKPFIPQLSVSKAPLFVTWMKKEGRSEDYDLRGCIGTFRAVELPEGLSEFALTSALRDSRFDPITQDEVSSLEVHVSLLSNFQQRKNVFDWTPGTHGIRIAFGGGYGATYLPEVSMEHFGGDKDKTLSSLIRKAGYRGRVDKELLDTISLETYESSVSTARYSDYLDFMSKRN